MWVKQRADPARPGEARRGRALGDLKLQIEMHTLSLYKGKGPLPGGFVLPALASRNASMSGVPSPVKSIIFWL